MSKNNVRKYVSGSRSAHVSNFGSAVTHCDGRSRNHCNYISRLAECFESVGDDRIDHELSLTCNYSLASVTSKRKYSAAFREHVLQRTSQRKYHKKINLVLVAATMCHYPEVFLLEIHGMVDQTKTGLSKFEERREALDRCEVVKNYIVGVLINGSEFFVVTHRDHWKRTANVTLSIL